MFLNSVGTGTRIIAGKPAFRTARNMAANVSAAAEAGLNIRYFIMPQTAMLLIRMNITAIQVFGLRGQVNDN